MKLPSGAQNQLMFIIQDSANHQEEDDQREKVIEEYKQSLGKLEFAYNNLVTENQGLRAALF